MTSFKQPVRLCFFLLLDKANAAISLCAPLLIGQGMSCHLQRLLLFAGHMPLCQSLSLNYCG